MLRKKQNINRSLGPLRFRRWSRKAYSVLASLHREISIGHVCKSIANAEFLKKGSLAVATTGQIFRMNDLFGNNGEGSSSGSSGPDELELLVAKVLSGAELSFEEAVRLPELGSAEELCEASKRITAKFCDSSFDLCSIINAKSGRCPENCRWCAQSAHYSTGVKEYPLVPVEEALRHALHNEAGGIRRFSWVTSGRRPSSKEIDEICNQAKAVAEKTSLKLCASLGLIGEDELRKLYSAGITRYHCNLETAPSYFPELCSTHTTEQKMKTIESARKVGMDVCCGGIIGMGESWKQRVEFAFYLKNTGTMSIPLNLLQPIPGTPLEHQSPLSSKEIIDTVVMFRFVHPKARLRLAGGRVQIDRTTLERLLKAGVNAAISGDLLTTTGSRVKDDIEMIKSCGYEC